MVTGRLGTEGGCSLVADEPYIIRAALDGMRQYIDIAEKLGSRNRRRMGPREMCPKGGSREKYLGRLAKNLGILAAYGADRGVKLNLEVINRYETNIFNSAEETLSFLDEYALGNCFVHLDTFHMGIEEAECARRDQEVQRADRLYAPCGTIHADTREVDVLTSGAS